MTIEQMRAALGLSADVSDADVIAAYSASQVVEPLLTVEQAKNHVRLDADDLSQDDYLALLIEAAQRAAEHYVDRPLGAVSIDIVEADLSVVRQAMLLMVGHWFANREADTMPAAVNMLLGPLRKWSV